jgi:hypothetical protein
MEGREKPGQPSIGQQMLDMEDLEKRKLSFGWIDWEVEMKGLSEFWDFICEHSVCRLSGDGDDQVSHGHLGFHMVTSRVYKSSQPYYVSLRVCSGPQQTRPFSLCERPAEISTRSSASEGGKEY